MRLVPRQLRRPGMTGNVPYYGGRMTPGQAYAVSHPPRPASAPQQPAPSTGVLESLRHLRDNGVITPEEYEEFCRRIDA
jgi:hypothetical protein